MKKDTRCESGLTVGVDGGRVRNLRFEKLTNTLPRG